MADQNTFGRRPVVIVELVQPRCSKRFGVSACTATGTPKCYNCYWTCRDKENFDTDGSITWRFTRPGDEVGWLYEEDGANNIKTNAIPILVSASHTSTRINLGASRQGESPLGRRATAQIRLSNAIWDDHVGDFYLPDRPPRDDKVGFWTLFSVRNPFTPNMRCVIYEGYEGQDLAEMQSRLFEVEHVSGPDSSDGYTISCRDPLDRVRGKNAKYPPASEIDVAENVTSSQTSIAVTCLETEISADFGNTGSTRYLVIDDEIITYTGWTGSEPNFTLTGVTRGVFQSTPKAYEVGEALQRGAFHNDQRLYDVARELLESHSNVDASFVDGTQIDEEGALFLGTFRCRTFLPSPVPVEDLLGELCRDGLFSLYWDERAQKIRILAVRPPVEVPLVWTDDANLASFSRAKKSDDRMTRVTIYFDVRNWLGGLDDPRNFRNRRIRIDGEVESENATGGDIVENTYFSRWINTFGNALLVGSSLLLRYRLPPEYITLALDAKDRETNIGDVVDLTTRHVRDPEGSATTTRWQVIAIEDLSPGSTIRVELQSYQYVGRFAVLMDDDSPDYADATEEQRAFGFWLADDDGRMPDGSDPYLLQ